MILPDSNSLLFGAGFRNKKCRQTGPELFQLDLRKEFNTQNLNPDHKEVS